MRFARVALALFFAFSPAVGALGVRPAFAGTTGVLAGRAVDTSGQAIAHADVAAVSPSQSARTVSDANGEFRFLSLAPDTYTISISAPGYEPAAVSGVNVLADQTQTLTLTAGKALRTIARSSARSVADLVKPGVTSDVYSVNAAGAEAARGLGGPGGVNSAYSAIASVPGAIVQQGQQGWYQTVNIRGGDIDQVGYELDGIPTNRVYDNAPQTMLSNLGQQELQVYTGGTPASAEASGIAGYINQVIRTGTRPGFIDIDTGIGGPAFYHKLSFEAGGANPSRTFSYYVGVAGVNQDYRYGDQFNGVSDPQLFYPVYFPEGRFNLYDGTAGPINNAPGPTYAIANTMDRENVVNLHFGIPHHGGALRDDVQALYLTSEIVADYYSSINDQGGPANVANAVGGNGNAFYHDGWVYNGPLFSSPNIGDVAPYSFPNSANHPFEGAFSNDARDYSDNGVALTKLQYTHNISQASYLKLYGYTEYSNWFIGGPSNQDFTGYYGAELNDYELPSHTFGFNATYANQLSSKNLLSATASYTASEVQRRFSYGFPGNTPGAPFTNLIDANGNCYSPATLGPASCFDSSSRGTFPGGPPGAGAFAGYVLPTGTLGVTSASGTPTTATWLVTDNGFVNSRFNDVSPVFSAASLTDQLRPNDRLTVNLGVRVENYDNRLGDTGGGAARDFWFAAYNREHCYVPGAPSPVDIFGSTDPVTLATVYQSSLSACRDLLGANALPANLVNAGAGTVSKTVYEPRFGFTEALDTRTVLRGSVGVYARPVNTSWLQYNAVNSDLASFIGGNFLTYGYNSTTHPLQPDTSLNADFSLEKSFAGGTLFKVTPFYRGTSNQLQPVPIGVGGVVSGFNVGKQTSTGVEVALRQGDFARNGFAAQLAYTYTHSRITYNDFPSGTNVIDGLNQYIAEYNSYTSACATVTTANSKLCGLAPGSANPNASPTFASNASGISVTNPYYGMAAQPLMDRNGSYTTYDQIPQPFTGENGYETPHVASLIVSYKHDRFSIAPSLTFSSGASYGSPLAYPGYVPTGCDPVAGTVVAGVAAADPKSCTGASAVSGLPFLLIPDAFTGRFDTLGAFKEPSRLTLNLGSDYEIVPHVKISATLTGLVDRCFQRGYAWDDPHICVYSQLPSGGAGLGPSGNFLPLGATPIEFRYPYGVFSNNLNTGFLGSTLPFSAFVSAKIAI